jgi:hypothetical protein
VNIAILFRSAAGFQQNLSSDRGFGYTLKPAGGVPDLAGKPFRTCDFYAWLLPNRIEEAPTFQPYWPEAERETAITALETMLTHHSGLLKIRPFQER